MYLAKFCVVIMLVVGLIAVPALGQQTTTLTASGSWNNPSNWSNNVPSATLTAIIPTSLMATIFDDEDPGECLDLDIQGSGIVRIESNDLTIYGGDLDLGANARIEFAKTDTARPQLLYANGKLTINAAASGATLDASAGSSLGPANIKTAPSESGELESARN